MVQQGVMTKSRTKPRNILKGIVPTYTNFDATTPTNLANATDDDPATATGVGQRIVNIDEIGRFIFDLGSDKRVLIGGKVGIYASTGNVNVYLSGGTTNGETFNWGSLAQSSGNTSELKVLLKSAIVYGRYVTLVFRSSGNANPASVILYSIWGFEV